MGCGVGGDLARHHGDVVWDLDHSLKQLAMDVVCDRSSATTHDLHTILSDTKGIADVEVLNLSNQVNRDVLAGTDLPHDPHSDARRHEAETSLVARLALTSSRAFRITSAAGFFGCPSSSRSTPA